MTGQLAFGDSSPGLACLTVPALPLQLVLKQHPTWRQDPLVIVESDRATAAVLWCNSAATKQQIFPGSTFNQARALCSKLRAHTVDDAEIQCSVEQIFHTLLRYSPYVEPAPHVPGLFFLDPTGLGGLFGSFENWAQSLQQTLQARSFASKIAVGFRRPWLYAISHFQKQAIHLSEDRTEEQEQACRVPLARLHLSPQHRQALSQLGVHTVADLLRLPHAQLHLRYGAELANLHAFLSGSSWTPLQPAEAAEPMVLTQDLEPPDDDVTRLLFSFKNQLQEAVAALAKRSEAITALSYTLHMDYQPTRSADNTTSHGQIQASLAAAAPTLDIVQWTELLRLRLTTLTLPAPICATELTLQRVRVHPTQLSFQSQQSKRNLTAANRALARIRSLFDNDAVTTPQLRKAHLPEAGYTFAKCDAVKVPTPQLTQHLMPLVRCVYRPRPLPAVPTHASTQWISQEGALSSLVGPYRVSGGWWAKSAERDYYFARSKAGDTLWIYYDRPRARWFIHGVVR